jgi:hypothetical protein
MNMNSQTGFSSTWGRASSAVLRAIVAVAAIVLMVGALLLGLVVAAGIVCWALLRGRRPGPVNLRWGTTTVSRGPRQAPTGEVVDVQVRELDRS